MVYDHCLSAVDDLIDVRVVAVNQANVAMASTIDDHLFDLNDLSLVPGSQVDDMIGQVQMMRKIDRHPFESVELCICVFAESFVHHLSQNLI